MKLDRLTDMQLEVIKEIRSNPNLSHYFTIVAGNERIMHFHTKTGQLVVLACTNGGYQILDSRPIQTHQEGIEFIKKLN